MNYYDNFPFRQYRLPCMMQNQYMMPQTNPGMMYDQYVMPQPIYSMMPQEENTMPQELTGKSSKDDIYTYPQNLPAALQLIQDATSGENEDRKFYEYLISVAPTEDEKNIIRGIRDDEIGHFSLFREIYYELTGRTLPPPEEKKFAEPATYCEGLKRALRGEQGVVPKYRRILFALQDRVHINKLTAIITDELRHGILYNYMYSKNNCNA